MSTEQQFEWFKERFDELVRAVEGVILGKRSQVELAVTCLLAEGHLLVEDVPGTGKTALAKTLATLVEGSWSRIQFTPDLLPADVTGVTVFDQGGRGFEFHPGPVFSNIVVADEINRASPKTQAALLEVMDEGHVTVDGTSYEVPRPFIVVATQNPVEFDGTYRLPEAQLDRFLMRIRLGYPDLDAELDVVESGGVAVTLADVRPVLSTSMVRTMQEVVDRVEVVPEVQGYVLRLARATRDSPDVRLGVSTRAVMGLVRAARARAAAAGRHYVQPEDVKDLIGAVWAHRVLLTSDAEFAGRTATGVLDDLANNERIRVPVS